MWAGFPPSPPPGDGSSSGADIACILTAAFVVMSGVCGALALEERRRMLLLARSGTVDSELPVAHLLARRAPDVFFIGQCMRVAGKQQA